jgi:hypothetical protein
MAMFVNANLPTEAGGGTYLGLNGSVSRVLPVTGGAQNTVYLNGSYITDANDQCSSALWGPVTINAVYFQQNPGSTFASP